MSGSDALIVFSKGFDPFVNLAREEVLFRSAPAGRRTLYLWVNDPVVVIGRYQNPWIECRLKEMEKRGVAFARRQSGGGAVYHDRGNLCVTFMGPRRGFDREANIALVRAALGDLGIRTETNERNDILLDGRKVSGSAYRESADRSFHHLTLLIDSDLESLSGFLKPGARFSRTKGIASVRSPVANLRSAASGLTTDAAAAAIAARFAPGSPIETAAPLDDQVGTEIEAVAERWKSWEWRFGGSPEFALTLSDWELEVRGGLIVKAQEGKEQLESLIGARFSPAAVAGALRDRASEKERTGDWEGAQRAGRGADEAERL